MPGAGKSLFFGFARQHTKVFIVFSGAERNLGSERKSGTGMGHVKFASFVLNVN